MSIEDTIGVVLDLGSLWTKAGFSGESFPRCIIPTAVGRFRDVTLIDGVKDCYFGKEAIRNRGISNMTWPIKDGMIENWNEVEKLWHHILYSELHVAPEEAKVLFAIHPLTEKRDKEKISEILFETFTVQGLYLAASPALALYASSRTTGVVCEVGHSCSYITPVFEGFPLKHATVCSTVNGRILTDYLQNLLSLIGYSFKTPTEMDILNRMKTDLCFVSSDYENELLEAKTSNEKVHYDLCDGQHVIVGEERFKCPEALFQPSLLELNYPNIIDNIYTSISKCDLDYRNVFYKNIVLSGGSTMFLGLPNRIDFELKKKVINVPDIEVFVDALPSRNVVPWVGGSIFASIDSSNSFWMKKEEYDDAGSDRVNYKFY